MTDALAEWQIDEAYPRPQLVREDWIDLCGEWTFAHDDAEIGLGERWYASADGFDRTITVPIPPESQASGIHDPGYHPTLWYRRSFTLPRVERLARTLLHFGAVDYEATVWINGSFAGSHRGGHTPFTLDISALLHEGDAQVVNVRVHDDPHKFGQPRGKQYWEERPGGI